MVRHLGSGRWARSGIGRAWTFSAEGAVLLGEQEPVTHLSCKGDLVDDSAQKLYP
ncbi:MAG: hypothetical protein OT477_06165 [Chloroflexi bacterium]|nr:hypothetical protein [Chloroflexota bacterium]